MALGPTRTDAAPTLAVDDVRRAWQKALGDPTRIESASSVTLEMTVETAGLEGTAESIADTGRLRESLDLDHGAYSDLRVFDGVAAWQKDRNGKVRRLDGVDLAEARTGAYFRGLAALLPASSGAAWELLDDAPDGAWRVRILPTGGKPVTVTIDPASGRPRRWEMAIGDQLQVTTYESWRSFDGVRIADRQRQSTGDPRYDVVIRVVDARFDQAVAATTFAEPPAAPSDVRYTSERREIDLPLEIANNHVFIPVRFGDGDPLWAVADTGAEYSVIDRRRAAAMGAALHGAFQVTGSGAGSQEAALVPGVTIHLDGVDLVDQTVVAVPLAHLEPWEGRSFDAILGFEFFGRFVVEIDYAARRMRLHDPATWRYQGQGVRLPFRLEAGSPTIEARLIVPGRADTTVKLLVDTGARLALALARPTWLAGGLREALGSTFAGPGGFGIGGESQQVLARLPALEFAGLRFADVLTQLVEDEKKAGAEASQGGILGGEILRRFRVYLDYGRSEMVLEPNSAIGEPFLYDASGMLVLWGGSDRYRVDRVIPGTPAAEAGVAGGDELLSLDDRPVADWTLDTIRQRLRQAGSPARLTLRRAGATIELTLALRPLV